MAYLGIFGLEFEKTIAMFEITTLVKFNNNQFLTTIVNFGIESAFLKGQGCNFYEGLCLVYKVCPITVY